MLVDTINAGAGRATLTSAVGGVIDGTPGRVERRPPERDSRLVGD